jgi:hypothetical protein
MSLLFRRAVRSKDKKIAEAYKTAYNKMLKDHGKKKKKKDNLEVVFPFPLLFKSSRMQSRATNDTENTRHKQFES